MDIFKKASRMGLRITTDKGDLSVDDLWNLPLTSKSNVSLDNLATAVNREIKSSEEESFVEVQSEGNATLTLTLDILKEIIKVRQAENAAIRTYAANKLRKDKLLGILSDKQDEDLKGMTVEQIQEEIAAIG